MEAAQPIRGCRTLTFTLGTGKVPGSATRRPKDGRKDTMNFETLGLKPRLLKQLKAQGILKPTPIQQEAIPYALNGRDVLGLAQTGTGKTAAFGLPLIQTLMSRGVAPEPKTAASLVLAPTRELANQIADALALYTKGSHLKVAVVVGGVSIIRQIDRLRKGVDLLIATPGRLIDLLDRKAVRLDKTEFLVLDEADQMLDLGFIQPLRRIAPLLPKNRQTMMFSATMPKLMADISQQFLTDPVRVEVARPGVAADKIAQSIHFLDHSGKSDLLVRLLGDNPNERTLVFTRTKHGAERLMKKLRTCDFAAVSIHGNKSQSQRDRALREFKSGANSILVATDVAARGIDIPDVKFVYNYDLPNVPESYVHRIGRTARAGAEGRAIAFCAQDEAKLLRAIEKVLKSSIPVASGKSWNTSQPEPAEQRPSHKPRRRNRRRRNFKRAA